MLIVKSFHINDGEGMTAALRNGRLASGAHILVTDGTVAIPFEDGTPPSPQSIACALAETRNGYVIELELAEHSQRVNQAKLDALEAHRSTKEVVENKKAWEQAGKDVEATNNLVLMNLAEINRLKCNIDLLNQRIAELTK